jgi:hypothetical protein
MFVLYRRRKRWHGLEAAGATGSGSAGQGLVTAGAAGSGGAAAALSGGDDFGGVWRR